MQQEPRDESRKLWWISRSLLCQAALSKVVSRFAEIDGCSHSREWREHHGESTHTTLEFSSKVHLLVSQMCAWAEKVEYFGRSIRGGVGKARIRSHTEGKRLPQSSECVWTDGASSDQVRLSRPFCVLLTRHTPIVGDFEGIPAFADSRSCPPIANLRQPDGKDKILRKYQADQRLVLRLLAFQPLEYRRHPHASLSIEADRIVCFSFSVPCVPVSENRSTTQRRTPTAVGAKKLARLTECICSEHDQRKHCCKNTTDSAHLHGPCTPNCCRKRPF